MRRTLLLIFTLFMSMTMSSMAQTLTNEERRHINDRLLELIKEYERTSDLFDYDDEYTFRSLFQNEQMPIVCDVMGFPGYLDNVSVDEYVSGVKSEAMSFIVKVKDITKGDIKAVGSQYEIPVQFRKSISYIDRNDYQFSTEQYYQSDLIMNMTVCYDLDTDECFITGLDATVESEREFPKGRFYILNKSDIYDIDPKYHKYVDGLRIGNRSISYNEFDQAILPSGSPEVGDIDVSVYPDTLKSGFNYDVVKFGFDVMNTRIKLHTAVAPRAYKVDVPYKESYFSSETNAFEAGVDVGFLWSAGRKSKMGFFFGAGVSMSYIGLMLNENADIKYDYNTSVLDSDTGLFKPMTVHYVITSAQEQMKLTDFYIPVYFELEHRAGRHMMISWNFGVKGYYNMSVIPTYTVAGTMAIDDNDFKAFTPLKDGPYVSHLSYSRNPLDFSVFGNLGIDINLFRQKAYFSLKGGYEYGLMDSYSSDVNKYYDKTKKVYPVVYDPIGEKNVAFHSLITDLAFRRRMIWIQAGFKFKI